jgi:hypothetical protein
VVGHDRTAQDGSPIRLLSVSLHIHRRLHCDDEESPVNPKSLPYYLRD